MWGESILDYFTDLPGTGDRRPEHVADVTVGLRGLRPQHNHHLQDRIGFAATQNSIEITTAERTCQQTAGGSFKPTSGGWHASTQKLPVQPASIRKAHVIAGELTSADTAGPANGPKPRAHASALEAIAVLPDAVTRGLFSTIPQPTAFLGQIVRLDGGGLLGKARQRVTLLRVDARIAIVLVAERVDKHDAAWAVTEYSYELKQMSRELAR